jgi:hypothetical protein
MIVIVVARVVVIMLMMLITVTMRMSVANSEAKSVAMTVRLGVRALLRIERRVEGSQPSAEPPQHVLDHMIAANTQPVADDLHLDVPVADVPGEPRQRMAVGRGDFDQRFRAADDPNDAAIVEHKTVAVAQSDHLRQIEQKRRPAVAGQNDPSALPLMRVEQDLIDRAAAVPMARHLDGMRAFHLAHEPTADSSDAILIYCGGYFHGWFLSYLSSF